MLYINNKYLNLDRKASDEFDKIRSDFHRKIDALKAKFGDFISLEVTKKPKRNSSGLLEPWRIITAPLKQVVAGDNGSEEWVYTASVPQMKDGYIVPDSLQELIRNGELRINLNEDPDKAYFFLYKHLFVKLGKLKLVDLQSDEEKKAVRREREADLNTMIYSKATALNDVEKLKVIARRWGVFNTDKLTPAQIKNKLYDVVLESDNLYQKDSKSRNINDFLDDCQVNNSVKIGAVIQEAMDLGYLEFEESTRQWRINYQDGGMKPILLAVAANEIADKREILISHLMVDYKSLEKLENVLGKSLTKEASPVLDADIISRTEDMSVLRSQAKLLGINTYQMKREEIKESILSKMEEPV